MDKCRQMDNMQNLNARYMDPFGAGRTSVRITNPPGKEILFII